MLLLAAVLLVQGGWRPTVDNISNFPTVITVAERRPSLARLDPIIPIVKAALGTDGVEWQASRSFDANPEIPGWPLPRSLLFLGYEWSARSGEWEGEAATSISVFANNLDPMLSIAIDAPRTFVLRNQRVLWIAADDKVPWHPVSQREFVNRLRMQLTRRARYDATARSMLAQLEADAPAATDAPMLLPAQYQEGTWPGFRRPGVRQVVDVDSAFYRGKPKDAIVFLVLIGRGGRREIPVRRVREFWRALDREALRRLIE